MIVACVSFPFGWNSDEFRKICSPEANRFEVGLCSIRWAYILAIIGKEIFLLSISRAVKVIKQFVSLILQPALMDVYLPH